MASWTRQVVRVCEPPLQSTVTAIVLLNEYLPLIQQCLTMYWTAETTPVSAQLMLAASVVYAAVDALTYSLLSHTPVQPFVIFYMIILILPAMEFIIIAEVQRSLSAAFDDENEKALSEKETTWFIRWLTMPNVIIYFTTTTAIASAGLRHYALDLSVNSAELRATEYAIYLIVIFLVLNLSCHGLVMFWGYTLSTIGIPRIQPSAASLFAVLKTLPWIAVTVGLRTVLRSMLNEATFYHATTDENNAWIVDVPQPQAAFYSQERLQWIVKIRDKIPQWVFYLIWSATILQHLPWRFMIRYAWSRVRRQA